MHTGKIMANSDWLFHASRVEEIFNNICHGSWLTFISTQTFNHTGAGSFLFYPYLFIYPWALMRLVFDPIISFYLWYGLMLYIAFLIAYFSMLSFSKNRYQSFSFSLIYVLSAYRLYLGMWTLGEFIGTSFLPLVFLGFYKVFFSKRDDDISVIILGIGMTLLIYSHILSVVITVEIFTLVLIIALLINTKFILKKWKSLLYSILITVILTLPIIYIFATNYFGNDISSTNVGILLDQLSTFSDILENSFNNVAGSGIGIVLIITAFIGWYFVKGNRTYVCIYLLGLLLLIVSSKVFPWYLMSKSILGIIQLPYRYLSYSSLFLSIVASRIICLFLNHMKFNCKIGFMIILCILGVLSYYSSLETMVSYIRNASPTKLVDRTVKQKLPFTILSKDNYERQFNYRIPWGETDYYPNSALTNNNAESIISQISYSNGRAFRAKSNFLPNRIMYKIKVKKKANIDLPIISYHGTYAKIDEQEVKHEVSSRGTVLLSKKQLKSKSMLIEVGYNPGKLYYLCLVISLVVWLIIFWKCRKIVKL
jgi:hypothetical protein